MKKLLYRVVVFLSLIGAASILYCIVEEVWINKVLKDTADNVSKRMKRDEEAGDVPYEDETQPIIPIWAEEHKPNTQEVSVIE